jgi:hypothetical protein
MTTTTTTKRVDASLILPHIICRCCDRAVSTVNYPVMSKTCPHSICCTCLTASTQKKSNDNDNAGCFLKCPICQQDSAFHAHRSQPNYMAIAAMDILEQSVRLVIQQQKQLKQQQQQQQQQKSNRNATKKASVISTPSSDDSNDSNDDTTHDDDDDDDDDESLPPRPKKVVTPPLPGQSRMVWIKFDSGSQLANLLAVHHDQAEIRWDGYKYTEWVDLERVEEMMDSTEKRACRRVPPSMKLVFHNDSNNKDSSFNKNKRRRKKS